MDNDATVFYANAAQPEEQGSLCDTGSKIHYQNVSRDEAIERAAANEWVGGDSDFRYNYNQGDDVSELPEETRFNTTSLSVDSNDHYYPAVAGPKNEKRED